MRRALVMTLVVLGLLPVSCGGDSSDAGGSGGEAGSGGSGQSGGGTAGNPSLEQAPALLAEAFCDGFSQCMPPVIIAQWLGTRDCDSLVQKQFDNALYDGVAPAVARGTVVYDGSELQDCLDAIRASGCVANEYYPECEAALGGTVPEGGECLQDAECEGDRFCLVDALCPGTCSEKLADGEACERDADCGVGSQCFEAVCTPQPAAGESCREDGVDCSGGNFCFGADDDLGRPGVCRSPDELLSAALGESCDIERQLCEPGAFCSVALEGGIAVWSCVAQASTGGDCRPAFPDMCPPGEYCSGLDPDSGDLDGTCAELPTDGSDCTAEGRCASEHVCVEATRPVCVKMKPNGESCATGAECYSDRCEAGVCAPDAACAP